MNKKTIIIVATLTMTVALIVGLAGCENSTVTGRVAEDPAIGISADQISWVSWKPEVMEAMNANSLAKTGIAGKTIKPNKGGTVGGKKTFDNKVKVFPGGVDSNTYIEVTVVCIDGKDQCGSGVDFLPSMQFLNDIKVTLSWEFIDVDSLTVDDFEVYYSEDGGITWFGVPNPEIDYHKQTISVWTDHFTRYAWGLSINPSL